MLTLRSTICSKKLSSLASEFWKCMKSMCTKFTGHVSTGQQLSTAAMDLHDFQNRNSSMSAPTKHGQREQGTTDHQFRCDQDREKGCLNRETLMLLLALQIHILIFCRTPFPCRHTLRAKNTWGFPNWWKHVAEKSVDYYFNSDTVHRLQDCCTCQYFCFKLRIIQ